MIPRRTAALACVALACAAAAGAAPDRPAATAPAASVPADLAPAFRDWLVEVAALITPAERQAFLGLAADYQRRAFIEEFWRRRDPYPETGRNELRERWEAHADEARQRWEDLADPRAQAYLAHGRPAEETLARCGLLVRPLEVWHYRGSEALRQDFYMVFQDRGGGRWELWTPRDSLQHLLLTAPGVDTDQQNLDRLARECPRGDRLVSALVRSIDWVELAQRGVHLFPTPDGEWLRSFLSSTTDLPEGAGTFPATLRLSFPGARGGRTVVQGLLEVPPGAGTVTTDSGPAFDYVVDGEVLRGDELFENFRYRFRLPAAGGADTGSLPLVFQRYLRPGRYRLLVRVEDVAGGRYHREEREMTVPFVHRGEDAVAGVVAANPGDAADDGSGGGPDPVAEANRSLGRGDHTLRLLPPSEGLHTGNTRVEAVAGGKGIARVRFALDGRQVMSKSRPPYDVEIDLGDGLRTHEVSAVAVDAAGEELARDEILLNAGPHRFGVRLVEPQPGHRYTTSLRALAQVDVPEGEHLERVELYLNDDLVATLYQPPFAQPIVLPPAHQVAYVRAVAYLDGGTSAEDLVFVNAPENLDRIDVHLVELYTTVVDRAGRPVEGLDRDDFTVLEEGVEQRIRRFELVRNVPIYAGVLLDTSSSMTEELDEALAAATHFFEKVVEPKDRAAVITFSDKPQLAVRFTNDPEVLAGGLAGVDAVGGTALWDSLVYALYYFSGVQGKRALVLISDGDDQGSRYGFEEALDYARRTGVSIYAIGLGPAGNEPAVRSKLLRLANETGGQTFFVHRAVELDRVYDSIQRELRTQYLLAYQSSRDAGGDRDEAFRRVEVTVDRPGVEAKTLRGYYP